MARRRGPSLDRAQVVNAAIACIEREGPDALTVSRVAAELGIKPPSLYNHVGKGDALARAVVIEGTRRLLEVLKDGVRNVVLPRDQVRALALRTRAFARAHPDLWEFMTRIPPDNDHPEFAPVLQDTLDLFARPLQQLGVHGDDTVHAIRGLRAALQGFLLLETRDQFELDAAPDESFRWLIEAILQGIGGARPGPGAERG